MYQLLSLSCIQRLKKKLLAYSFKKSYNYSSVHSSYLGVIERPCYQFNHVKFSYIFSSARKRKMTNQTPQVLSNQKAHKVWVTQDILLMGYQVHLVKFQVLFQVMKKICSRDSKRTLFHKKAALPAPQIWLS